MVVGVEEVGVIWKPAEAKHNQHNDEHLGQLIIVKFENPKQSLWAIRKHIYTDQFALSVDFPISMLVTMSIWKRIFSK